MDKVACAVLVFDRPNYFKHVAESLANNILANEINWYFFVDGAITKNGVKVGKASGIRASIKIINDLVDSGKFKQHCVIESSHYNIGIAKQKQKAHFLFDHYDQVLFFEDDMIVSPYYINLLLNMQNAFPDDIVSAPDRRSDKIPKVMPDLLNKVRSEIEHLWGYSMRKDSYLKIRTQFDEYCIDVGDCYKMRPDSLLMKKYNLSVSSHDDMINKTTDRNGIKKICTVIPRGHYIGKEGTHFTTKAYNKYNFGEKHDYIFPEDESLTEFELI